MLQISPRTSFLYTLFQDNTTRKMHAGMKQALCCANNEKTTNQKERVRKACHRAWIGGQATPGIIMLHLSRWPSPLISSQLRILCQSFAHFSYLLLRGYHFEPCPRPADDAIIGLTDRFCLAAELVPAIKPLTYMVATLGVRQDSNLQPAPGNARSFNLCASISHPCTALPLSYTPRAVICPLPSQPSTSCAW